MRLWVGWAALVTLLALSSPAMAAAGTLQGHADTPIRVLGDRQATANDASFLLKGDEGEVSLLLQGAEGKATRVIQRAFGIVSSSDPQAEVLWSQSVERQTLDLAGGLLFLADRRPEFQVLADNTRAELSTGPAGGPLELAVSRKAIHVTETVRPPFSVKLISDSAPFEETISKGLYAMQGKDGHLTLDGKFRLFISGATVVWHPATGDPERIQAFLHKETRSGTVYNPVDGRWIGGGTHEEYVQEYIVVEATSGHLDLQFAGLPGALYAAHPTFGVEGRAVLPALQGTVKVVREEGEVLHKIDGQDLTLEGRFMLAPHTADADGRGTRVTGSGDITIISYGGVVARYDWASAAVAVGLGAILVAAAAWVAANGKAILGVGGGLVAGYARVHGDEVLEHPGRAEVYERVKAFPGVNFVQLSAQVGFGASTLNYHLRVLEKNGYITSVRDGRYLRFFDRTSGSYAGARKMAVSALRNETTAAMAKHIRDHPGVAQCDLAAAFHVTPSTVTWHINRLAGQGLVQKARDGAHTRYYIGEGWAALPAEEQLRQSDRQALAATA